MIDKIKKLIWKTEGQEDLFTPKNSEEGFKLLLGDLEVGTLSLKNGIWTFKYSDEFKKQNKIKPIPDFPNIDKVYTSEDLYPFFIQRIPGLGQQKVKETLRKEKIDEHNEAALLKRFGRLTITNPFELKAV